MNDPALQSLMQATLLPAIESLAADWRELAGRGLVDGSLAFAALLVLWLPLRKRLSPSAVCALFLLPLLRVALPFGVPLPEWLPTFGLSQLLAPKSEPVYVMVLGEQLAAMPMAAEVVAPPFWTLERALFVGWLGGVLLLSLRFWRAQARTRRAVLGAQPVDAAEFPLDLAALRARAGVRRPVRWLLSDAVASPAAGGLFSPYVLLPRGFAERLSAPQLSFVLLHELAHVRRGDVAVALAQRVLQIFWFFHPAVWFASWLIDQHRELACDQDAIARSGASRRVCGEAFLAVAEWVHGRTSLPTATLAMFDPNRVLKRRLMQILNTPSKSSRLLTAAYLVFAAAVALPAAKADDAALVEFAPIAQDQAQDAQREQLAELKKAMAELKKQQAALAKQLAQLDKQRADFERAKADLEVEGAEPRKGAKVLKELPVLGELFKGDVIEEKVVKGMRLGGEKLVELEDVLEEVAEVEGKPMMFVLRDGKMQAIDGDRSTVVRKAKDEKSAKSSKAAKAFVFKSDDGSGKPVKVVEVEGDGAEVIETDDGVMVFNVEGTDFDVELPKEVMKRVKGMKLEGLENIKPMLLKLDDLKVKMPEHVEFKTPRIHQVKSSDGKSFTYTIDVGGVDAADKPAKKASKAKKAKIAAKKAADDCDECEACDECEEACEVELRVEGKPMKLEAKPIKVEGKPLQVIRAKKSVGV